MTTIFKDIRQWSTDRNITYGATQHAQMVKLMEEVGELAQGIAKSNKEQIKDALGDCVVVLTILAAQNGLFIEGCIDHAYNEIKPRKGKMINGVWVKEEDIKSDIDWEAINDQCHVMTGKPPF